MSTVAIELCFCNNINALAELQPKMWQKATLNKGQNPQSEHFLRCASCFDFLPYKLLISTTLIYNWYI